MTVLANISSPQSASALSCVKDPRRSRKRSYDRTLTRAQKLSFLGSYSAIPPVLVIIGRDEWLHDGPKMAARFRQQLPEARIEIVDDANHIIPVDQPQIVEKLLADFLH